MNQTNNVNSVIEKLIEIKRNNDSISVDNLNALIPKDVTPQGIDEIYDFLCKYKIIVTAQDKTETPGYDNDISLDVFLENRESFSPDELFEKQELLDKITSALMFLSPREEKFIRLRFGIGEDTCYTLEEIGERFNVSPEQVKHIATKALKRLARKLQ